VGKLDDDAEDVSPRGGLPQYVLDRVSSGRPRTLNQCLAKANFFYFFGLNTVTGNVIDSIIGPDKLANLHPLILHPDSGQPSRVSAAERRGFLARRLRPARPRAEAETFGPQPLG